MKFEHVWVVGALLIGAVGCSTVGPEPKANASVAKSTAVGPVGDTYSARHTRAFIVCMTDRGWKLEYDPKSGGAGGQVPPEQREAHSADSQSCNAEFESEFPPPVLSEADMRELYRQELVTVECLRKAGYPPLSEPVSEQQYVAALISNKGSSWYAYQALGATPDPETFHDLEKKCPQPSVDG